MTSQWNPDALPRASRLRLKLAGPGFEIPFTVIAGKELRPVALVMAGVHGDEYEGPAAVQDLAAEIDPFGVSGTIVLVPVANPPAFYAATRRNPVDLGDLNRGFPGNPQGSATERLAHILFREFALASDCILSLHGWSKEAAVVPYAEYPAGDTDAARQSCAAARALGLRWIHPYPWPDGVLGAAALQHGIPTVETEVGGMGTITREGQALYRAVILRFLAHFRIIGFDGPPATGPIIVRHADVFANHAGLFLSQVNLGDRVEAGQLLGIIRDLSGDPLEELRAPEPGFIAILRTLASVQLGDRLVQLFAETEKT